MYRAFPSINFRACDLRLHWFTDRPWHYITCQGRTIAGIVVKWHATYDELLHFALSARIPDQHNFFHGSSYIGRVAGWVIHILYLFSG